MPEIQKASVAAPEEQVTTQEAVADCFEDVSIGQIVGEAIRDWHRKRGLHVTGIERLLKRRQEES